MKKKSNPIDPTTRTALLVGGGVLALGGLVYLFQSSSAASSSNGASPPAAPSPPPASGAITTTFTPGHRYFATLFSPGPVATPSVAATQTSFDAQYGVGATNIIAVNSGGANVVLITFDVVTQIPPLRAVPSVETVLDLGPSPSTPSGSPSVNFLVPATAAASEADPSANDELNLVAGSMSTTIPAGGTAIVYLSPAAKALSGGSSNNPAVATVASMPIWAILITAVAVGSAVVSISWTDTAGAAQTTQIYVTVTGS